MTRQVCEETIHNILMDANTQDRGTGWVLSDEYGDPNKFLDDAARMLADFIQSLGVALSLDPTSSQLIGDRRNVEEMTDATPEWTITEDSE